MRSSLRRISGDSQKNPIGSIFHIWSSSQRWLGEPMDMLQIHWIFAGRGDTRTPPQSDFTTNPRNQTDFSMDSILIFKRFGWNWFLLKYDHRLGESPATSKCCRWSPNLVQIPYFCTWSSSNWWLGICYKSIEFSRVAQTLSRQHQASSDKTLATRWSQP